MPVTFQQPSPTVTQQARAALQGMAQQKHFRIQSLATAAPATIDLESPHAVYNFELDDIASHKSLDAARFTAWRYIVRSSTAQPAAAEMHSNAAGTTAEFSSVNDGPFVAGTIAAFNAVSSDPGFSKGDWEIRLLRIPALFVMAVWAHEKTGVDMLRPIAPVPPFLDANKTYTAKDFLAALDGPAREKLSTDDRPKD
jgi:hypothetical protein